MVLNRSISESSKGGADVILNPRFTPRPILILPGDVLEIVQGEDVWEWTAPMLSVTFDVAAQPVIGQAPPLATLKVIHNPNDYDNYWFTATAAVDGSFYLPLPEDWQAQPGDVFEVDTIVDGVIVAVVTVWQRTYLYLYQSDVEVVLPPLTPFTLTQFSREGTPMMTITAMTSNFGVRWLYSDVEMQPGMRVLLESVPYTRDYTLPEIVLWVDKVNGVVRGSAPPLAELRLNGYFVYPSGEWLFVSAVSLTADAQGTFEFRPAEVPFRFAQGNVTYVTPDGEWEVQTAFSTPGFDMIRMDTGLVALTAMQPGKEITVTLRTAAGVFTQTEISGAYSGATRVDFNRRLYPDDVLTLFQDEQALATLTVPNLQAQLLAPEGILYGKAPPGAQVEVLFKSSYYAPSSIRYAISDSAGAFALDVSDIESQWGSGGTLILRNFAGTQVWETFDVVGYRVFLPVLLR